MYLCPLNQSVFALFNFSAKFNQDLWIVKLTFSVNCFIEEFGPELSEGNEDEMKTFNEDIVCSHGTVPSSASRMILANSL